MTILRAFATAHNLLNRQASAVGDRVQAASIVMQHLSYSAIGARLCHGGVVGADRFDRVLQSPRFAPTPDGIDTVRPARP